MPANLFCSHPYFCSQSCLLFSLIRSYTGPGGQFLLHFGYGKVHREKNDVLIKNASIYFKESRYLALLSAPMFGGEDPNQGSTLRNTFSIKPCSSAWQSTSFCSCSSFSQRTTSMHGDTCGSWSSFR